MDAIVLLSFGGPETAEEVMPFLRRVVAGRDVPEERLASVAEHYYARGGKSPINDCNRALLAALRTELTGRGVDTPIYWGNRNAAPFLVEALSEAVRDGARTVRILTTSAYPSYSGCRQYQDDTAAALAELEAAGLPVPSVEFCEHQWNQDGFIAATVDGLVDALTDLPSERPQVLFTTHSIPTRMAATSGPTGGEYVSSHEQVMQRVMAAATARTAESDRSIAGADLVYCSRSGPPQVPWLEPDVNDRIQELADTPSDSAGPNAGAVDGVVVVPIGFVSDHMEVVQDLDTEAAATAAGCGLGFARVPTVGTNPRYIATLADLVTAPPRHCPLDCCPRPVRPGSASAGRTP